MADIIPDIDTGNSHVGGSFFGTAPQLRDGDRETDQDLPDGMALGVRSGRAGMFSAIKQIESEGSHGHEGGKKTSANWDAKRSWNYVFTMISLADTFWHTQVHAPALTWPWVTEGNLNPRV